jgi:RNA polymerase sigma factor (sigma-70 family)
MRELIRPNQTDTNALFRALQERPSYRTLEVIYNQYRQAIRNYLEIFLGEDRDDLQDALSDVFAAVWEQRSTLADRDRPFDWVLRIARNIAIDQYRRKNKFIFVALDNNELLIELHTKQTELEYQELENLVLQAAEQLPNKEKEVFLLSTIDGLSQAEISMQQNTSVQTVKNQLHRAMVKVRKYVSDRFNNLFI